MRRLALLIPPLSLMLLGSLGCARGVSSSAVGAGAAEGAAAGEKSEGPGADELDAPCAHSYALLVEARGVGSTAVREDFMVGCRRNNEARRQADPDGWEQRRRCVLAAADQPELARCDGAGPELAVAGSESMDEVLIGKMCNHVIDLLAKDPSLGPTFDDSTRAMLQEECTRTAQMALSENGDKFRRNASCALEAVDLAGLDDCGD